MAQKKITTLYAESMSMKKLLMSLACLAITAVAGDTKIIDNGNTKIFTIELHEDLHVAKNEDSLFMFIHNDCFYMFRATIVEDNRIAFKSAKKQCGKSEVKVPQYIKLKHSFDGTLISWDFIQNGEKNETN